MGVWEYGSMGVREYGSTGVREYGSIEKQEIKLDIKDGSELNSFPYSHNSILPYFLQ
jgi:hypothetical protein